MQHLHERGNLICVSFSYNFASNFQIAQIYYSGSFLGFKANLSIDKKMQLNIFGYLSFATSKNQALKSIFTHGCSHVIVDNFNFPVAFFAWSYWNWNFGRNTNDSAKVSVKASAITCTKRLNINRRQGFLHPCFLRSSISCIKLRKHPDS